MKPRPRRFVASQPEYAIQAQGAGTVLLACYCNEEGNEGFVCMGIMWICFLFLPQEWLERTFFLKPTV
jgi:hypothetical protein